MNDNVKLDPIARAPGSFARLVEAVEAQQAVRLKRRLEEAVAHAPPSPGASAPEEEKGEAETLAPCAGTQEGESSVGKA